MNDIIARKPAISRRLWILTALSGMLAVFMLWRSHVEYQARQRAKATERQARLATLRAEDDARRIEAERQAAKARTIERIGQLYREIDNLNQFGDRVQTSLVPTPRMLQGDENKAKVTR
jgi:hypothetical protein